MTWEAALLREAQRFTGEVGTGRRRPRPFELELPLSSVHPQILGDAALTSRIAGFSAPEAKKLGIPKMTLLYQQRLVKEGGPERVYRTVARRLGQTQAPRDGN